MNDKNILGGLVLLIDKEGRLLYEYSFIPDGKLDHLINKEEFSQEYLDTIRWFQDRLFQLNVDIQKQFDADDVDG